MSLQRRDLLKVAGTLSALGLAGCAVNKVGTPDRARVLVVGGGYGGATAAKYVRLLSDHKIDVVLVEPNEAFVSCPISNLVLGGSKVMADITVPYTSLNRAHGVTVVKDMVASIDTAKKTAMLASGASIRYDKLVLSPGIDLVWDSIAGLKAANAEGRILQAWKPAPKLWRCASSSKPCPTVASTPSPSPKRPTAAPPARTSAPARWPATSRRPSPRARC